MNQVLNKGVKTKSQNDRQAPKYSEVTVVGIYLAEHFGIGIRRRLTALSISREAEHFQKFL
jgi:hypothetical protein